MMWWYRTDKVELVNLETGGIIGTGRDTDDWLVTLSWPDGRTEAVLETGFKSADNAREAVRRIASEFKRNGLLVNGTKEAATT